MFCTSKFAVAKTTTVLTSHSTINSVVSCSVNYSGNYEVGATGTWTSITSALADLRTCMTGSVMLELQASYNCTVETYPLNFSGLSTTATNSLVIRPKTGIVSVITLSASASPAVLYFDGIDYVFIDGRPGGVGSGALTIENTNTAAGSAMTFSNDATYNSISYCTLKSNYGSYQSGVIVFGNGTTSGNSYNTIDNCVIDGTSTGADPSDSNAAENGIYSVTTNTVLPSNTNTVQYSEFKNIFVALSGHTSTRGIFLSSGNNSWIIKNNYFYDGITRTPAGSQNPTHCSIEITSGDGYTIEDNQIGGNDKSMTGNWTVTISSSNSLYFNYNALKLTLNNNNTSFIRRNVIKKMACTSYHSSSNYWKGIEVLSGKVEVGTGVGNGNIIGDNSVSSSIQLLSAKKTTSYPNFTAIDVASTSTVDISNNSIGGFVTQNTSTYGANLYGIKTSSTGVFSISTNTIAMIQLGGNSTGTGVCGFYGISQAASGLSTITNNVIKNISVYGTAASELNAIEQLAGADNSTINSNTITSVSNLDFGSAGSTYCIYKSAVSTSTIQSNTMIGVNHNNGYFAGIACSYTTSSSKITLIQSNTIGSSSTGSIVLTSSVTSYPDGGLAGIYIKSQGNSFILNSNVVSYLSCPTTTNMGLYYNLIGIYATATSSTVTQPDIDLSGNTVEYLSNFNTNTSSSGNNLQGINIASTYSLGTTIKKNKIRYLSSKGDSNNNMDGITLSTTSNTLTNNFIQILNSDAVSTYTVRVPIKGLSLTGTNKLFYNTIDIGGNSSATIHNGDSYCIFGANSGDYTFKNNIFQNRRTGASDHIHWILKLGTTNSCAINLNYNYYVSPVFTVQVNGNKYTNTTFTTAALGGTNSAYKTTSITIGDNASLTSTVITEVGIGEDLSNASNYPNCQDDIYDYIGQRNISGGTKGAFESGSSALPIELVSLGGDCYNNNCLLTWQTATEKNNKVFTIERSVNGVDFNIIGLVAGSGNSLQLRNYKFVDADDIKGIVYYRLSQEDYDGKRSHSNIISVDKSCQVVAEPEIILYPNPSEQNLTIEVKLLRPSQIGIEVVDAIGRTVKLINVKRYDDGIQSIEINLDELAKGIYFLNAEINEQRFSRKFVKL